MSKQEEIREGIFKIIEEAQYYSLKTENHPNLVTHRLCEYLQENGVVIKVDEELPKIFWHLTGGDELRLSVAVEDIIKAGYVAVEPLVED